MPKSVRLSRRKFLALTGAAAAQVAAPTASVFGAPAAPVAPRAGVQSLAGEWSFALDRYDVGAGDEAWYKADLAATTRISLPGILQTQGYGDDIEATTQFVAALPRDMAWYKLPQYAPYTQPGHVEVPYLSQPIKHYLGVAWYQREITIPDAWNGKRAALFLERTRWQTTAYLDDRQIGSCTSLVAPHEYDLGIVEPGVHRLTIRIDNRMILPYRPDGHSVSDAEGSTWNGIVGRIELSATSPVWIDDAQVYPNLAAKSAEVRVKIGNSSGKAGSGTLSADSVSVPVNWDEKGGTATINVPLPDATHWSEFTPVLQRLTVKLSGPDADDRRDVTFGMREIKADGKIIRLNGELFYLRATHDAGGFPHLGHPATDVATWKKIISTCKAWGLNGIRFHSWCPPEAAFIAGDELGFYFQPECGMWNSFDPQQKMLNTLRDESARIVRAYGNHPSLVMLNASNEPAGHYQEQLPIWDKEMRGADPRRLYSDGTGRPAPPPKGPGTPYAADFIVIGARGPRGWFGGDYDGMLQAMSRGSVVPFVGHEVGQWCAYPDFSVIDKFSGYMVPGNYRIWRDAAEEHGTLPKNKEIAHASGRFQVACYKEEIEANLRTASYSGIELLDLHDYLGQGGALVGLLDAFWESKGYVAPEEFRQFCNETVPLARFKDRVFTTADTLKADVELAHYGPKPLASVAPEWRVIGQGGAVVASGSLEPKPAPRGKNLPLGSISVELAKLHAPAKYRLAVELSGTPFHNGWDFWVYPARVDAIVPGDVTVTSVWTEAEPRLAAGGKVLFLAKEFGANDPRMSTVPIFWNHLMNPNGTTFLGLWNDAAHPALKGFPTESNCDWQWIDVIAMAHALNMNDLPKGLEPIVQPIDDWNRGWKLGLLYECAVGQGRLMVCAMDLDAARPGAPSLKRSVLDYMASAAFRPKVQVSMEQMRVSLTAKSAAAPVKLAPTSPDLVDPGQIRQPTKR